MARILYLNIHDLDYPRNRRVREFLVSQGHNVVCVSRGNKKGFFADIVRVLISGLRAGREFDYVVLSEFSVQFAAAARLVASRFRAPLITDAFVGLYETNVLDWQQISARSPKAIIMRALDRMALTLSSLCLIDTDLRAERLRESTRTPVMSIPVGAPDWATWRPIEDKSNKVKVLYYGNYIRLHGLDFVLDSIARMENKDSFRFTFLGDGKDRTRITSKCRELGLAELIDFVDPVPESELADVISQHSVVLGIFGTSEKAETVIANKVWQGLACGKPVITRESLALRELDPIVGAQLITVDVDDPRSLGSALTSVERVHNDAYPDASSLLSDYVADRYRSLASAIR